MNSHKTAISRKRLSAPAAWLRKRGLIQGRTLDYGCGRGSDARILRAEGFDPYFRPQPPQGLYQTILCTYVLNVISVQDDRDRVEQSILRHLAPGGTGYISVRNDRKALKGQTRIGTWQGYVTPSDRWKLIRNNGSFRLYSYTQGISR